MVFKNPTLDARPSAHAGWHSRRRKPLKPGRDFKRITAKIARIHWQRNFFDHRLRHDESEAEKFEYIRRNPVRAGLIRWEDEWPYVLFGESSGGSPETPAGD